MEISFLRSGTKVTMHSCSRCDTRSWQADGRPVTLGDVFEVVGDR